jgi:hypothetical protein
MAMSRLLADLRSASRRGNDLAGKQAGGGTEHFIVDVRCALSRKTLADAVCSRQTSWSSTWHHSKDWLRRGELDTCLGSLLMAQRLERCRPDTGLSAGLTPSLGMAGAA